MKNTINTNRGIFTAAVITLFIAIYIPKEWCSSASVYLYTKAILAISASITASRLIISFLLRKLEESGVDQSIRRTFKLGLWTISASTSLCLAIFLTTENYLNLNDYKTWLPRIIYLSSVIDFALIATIGILRAIDTLGEKKECDKIPRFYTGDFYFEF